GARQLHRPADELRRLEHALLLVLPRGDVDVARIAELALEPANHAAQLDVGLEHSKVRIGDTQILTAARGRKARHGLGDVAQLAGDDIERFAVRLRPIALALRAERARERASARRLNDRHQASVEKLVETAG